MKEAHAPGFAPLRRTDGMVQDRRTSTVRPARAAGPAGSARDEPGAMGTYPRIFRNDAGDLLRVQAHLAGTVPAKIRVGGHGTGRSHRSEQRGTAIVTG